MPVMTKLIKNTFDVSIPLLTFVLMSIFAYIFPVIWITVPYAIINILFIPGYLLTKVLFPKKNDINLNEQIAYSITGGVFYILFAGFILNYIFQIVDFFSILLMTSIVIIILLSIIVIQKVSRAGEQQITRYDTRSYSQTIRQSLFFTGLVLVTLIIIGYAIFHSSRFSPTKSNEFTEFSITSQTMESNKYTLKMGDSGDLKISITNHASRLIHYQVVRQIDNVLTLISTVDLANNQSSEVLDKIMIPQLCDHCKITYLLFEDGQPVPVNSLDIWISVVDH
jgi:uncharacterized membrane protein